MTFSEFIQKHKLEISFEQVKSRLDGLGEQFGKGASHWKFEVRDLEGSLITSGSYSMGSAHKGEPCPEDLLCSLQLDSHCGRQSYEEWADDFGYDTEEDEGLEVWELCSDTYRDFLFSLGSEDLSEFLECEEG